MGKAQLLDPVRLPIPKKKSASPKDEIKKLSSALKKATKHNTQLKENLSKSLPPDELEIYESYIEMINDPEVVDQTIAYIEKEQCNVDFAYYQIQKGFISSIEQLDDPYLKQRAEDLRMITNGVLECMLEKHSKNNSIDTPSILIADKIDPNQLAELNPKLLLGLITSKGGITDHTTIIAKALGIPFLIGVKNVTEKITTGDLVILDSEHQCVTLHPSSELIEQTQLKIERQKINWDKERERAKEKAYTQSNKTIEVLANVGSLQEAIDASDCGADGIGLLRTELCFIEQASLPNEKKHFEFYSELLSNLPDKTHTLRLLDFGSDKQFPGLPSSPEENPAMGNRALRLGFMHYELLLKPQIRAFLRLSSTFKIQILCPMITTLEDLDQIKKAIKLENDTIHSTGKTKTPIPPIGIMVEVPNVALHPELFVPQADFFSFGTNDLAQFIMAADRTNAQVAHYLEAANPSLVQCITAYVNHAKEYHKKVSICGELASNPDYLKHFIELGVASLSMPPRLIPKIKAQITSFD